MHTYIVCASCAMCACHSGHPLEFTLSMPCIGDMQRAIECFNLKVRRRTALLLLQHAVVGRFPVLNHLERVTRFDTLACTGKPLLLRQLHRQTFVTLTAQSPPAIFPRKTLFRLPSLFAHSHYDKTWANALHASTPIPAGMRRDTKRRSYSCFLVFVRHDVQLCEAARSPKPQGQDGLLLRTLRQPIRLPALEGRHPRKQSSQKVACPAPRSASAGSPLDLSGAAWTFPPEKPCIMLPSFSLASTDGGLVHRATCAAWSQ